jgi:hypothetical protein
MVFVVIGFARDSLSGVVQCLLDLIDDNINSSKQARKVKVNCHSGNEEEVTVKNGSTFHIETECVVEVSSRCLDLHCMLADYTSRAMNKNRLRFSGQTSTSKEAYVHKHSYLLKTSYVDPVSRTSCI